MRFLKPKVLGEAKKQSLLPLELSESFCRGAKAAGLCVLPSGL